jgi:hypothetical protein
MLGSAQAQEEGDDAAPAGSQVIVQQATGPIEEVVVTGQRTISSLRNEAGRETESFYQRLNAVIDKPEFEIRCQNENPPGSNISRRVCRTRYQEDLMSRAALSTIQGFGSTEEGELVFNGSPFDSQPEMVRMQQQFEQEILQAVNTDPQLNESVVRLMQLKAAVESYETPRQERRNAEREASD